MKTAFVDVDTQIDFMLPAGALYVPGAELILPRIAQLNRWASGRGIPILSTVDAHPEDDPEFRHWPPHCILGTLAQRKPESTLVPGQRIVTKQALDCFTSPLMEPAIAESGAERFVVYGVVTELCVRFAALGLLARGFQVEVVSDAILHLDPRAKQATFGEITARGGSLVEASSILAG